MLPEKRKRESQGGKTTKAVKGSQDKDFMSYMLANFKSDVGQETSNPVSQMMSSSDDDSDGEVASSSFSAFDLPNYDSVFNQDEEDESNKATKASTSEGDKAADSGGIIFVSDPTQLPQPLLFKTPTVMKPMVVGSGGVTSSSGQVVVVNQPASSTGKVLLPQVMPVTPKAQASQPQKPSPRSASRNVNVNTNSRGNISVIPQRPVGRNAGFVPARTAVPNRAPNIRPPVRNVNSPVVRNIAPKNPTQMVRNIPPGMRNTSPGMRNTPTGMRNTSPGMRNTPTGMRNTSPGMRNPSPESALATAAAQAVASGMSATNIMQQVVKAAQQAAQKVIRPTGPIRNQPRPAGRPELFNQHRFTPVANTTGKLVNGNIRPGMVRPLGPRPGTMQQMQSHQNGQSSTALEPLLARARKWKPYSDTLTRVSMKIAGRSATPLTLKQMNSLLRLKFSTKQIYDMCLWDMEHPDASLMEIAIQNAFKTEA